MVSFLSRSLLVVLLVFSVGVLPAYAVDTPKTEKPPVKLKDLPDLFAGASAPCEIKEGLISCSPEEGAQTMTLSLEAPICELFEQAALSKGAAMVKYKEYACSELLDPLPKNSFGAETFCIKQAISRDTATQAITKVELSISPAGPSTSDRDYCDAILTKTGTGIGGLFDIVRLLYDISLPILIALAVISLVGVGVFIMYAPGGGEESMKQAKEMSIRIFSGFLLLLLLRVFLGLISADLFGAADQNPTKGTEQESSMMSSTSINRIF